MKSLRHLFLGAVAGWTILLGVSILWEKVKLRNEAESHARHDAVTAWQRDMLYRYWAASHGGVYVLVTEKTPPNPYLTNVFERDLTTPSGRRLTLMNPAYMTRQVHELGRERFGLQAHVTSLKPIRPGNAPDAWEVVALQFFETGAREYCSIEQVAGAPHLRYMGAFVTERACLKCHAFQGYQEGDVRGGISVTVPLQPYYLETNAHLATVALLHMVIWLTGLGGLSLAYRVLCRRSEERKQAEETLRKSQESLKEAQRIARIGSWELNLQDKTLIWSDEVFRIFEIDQARFVATYNAFLTAIHPDDRDLVNVAYKRSLETRAPYEISHRLLMPDGRVKYVQEFCENFYAPNGRPLRSVGTVQDITERKQSEIELSQYREHLEELVSSRTAELETAREAAETANRAKSVFLANMSHELRTPLSAILGFSDIMRRYEGTTAAQRETLAIIHRSGDHLLGLINDVLEIAKIEAGRIVLENAPFDLGGMIRDVTDMLRLRAAEKGVQLRVDQSSRFPRYIVGDEAKLRQIVVNLLSNAIKATEQGGVTLRLGVKPDHADHLLIEVEDTGCGIAPEDQARIMQPFIQVGPQGKQQGTGLGLTISQQFVELMGGELSLTSAPGKGSTFRVDLPVQLAKPEEIPLAPLARGEVIGLAPDQPAFKVLVVEDQTESQLLLVRLLEGVGFDVKLAENGALGVEQFIAWQPDFIWMDRRMPVMDGKEATVRIRALPGGDKVKIAAVTASAFLENDAELLAAGFDAILHKPFRPEEIFDCMEQLLGLRFVRSAGEEEPPPLWSELTAKTLAALPEELRRELESALRSLDMALVGAVIGRVAELNPPLGAQLKEEADRLAYSEILQLLQLATAARGREG